MGLPKPSEGTKEMQKEAKEFVLSLPIFVMGFSYRTGLRLARMGLGTIGDLIDKEADDLLEINGFGVTCLWEVRHRLKYWEHLDIRLKGD